MRMTPFVVMLALSTTAWADSEAESVDAATAEVEAAEAERAAADEAAAKEQQVQVMAFKGPCSGSRTGCVSSTRKHGTSSSDGSARSGRHSTMAIVDR